MTRHFIMDGLMKAQEQVITEPVVTYDCDGKYGCGAEDVPEDEIRDRIVHDCGEHVHVLICMTCIKRGWDSRGDPRT